MTSAQERVIAAMQTGEPVVFEDEEPRDLPADWLARLLGGRIQDVVIHPRGLSIENAKITGKVDWSHDRFCRFAFQKCEFEYDIVANNLRVDGEARFTQSLFPTLTMVDATIGGDLALDFLQLHESEESESPQSFVINLTSIAVAGSIHLVSSKIYGSVRLSAANVGQGIYLNDAELTLRGGGTVLDGSFLKCNLDVRLHNSTINGSVSFQDAHIYGSLNFFGSTLDSNADDVKAVQLQRIKVGTSTFFRNAKISGEIDLSYSTIVGELGCEGATFNNPNGLTLQAYRAEIEGGASFGKWGDTSFSADGAISFHTASVGHLLFDDAELTLRGGGTVLDGSFLKCNLDVRLASSTINGSVSFQDAHIYGSLNFFSSTLDSNADDVTAVQLHRIRVGTSTFFRNAKISGRIDLSYSKIKSFLGCEGATFNNPNGLTLEASRAEIEGGASFGKWGDTSFSAVGTINFAEATVGGLNFAGARIACPSGQGLDGNSRIALSAYRAQIKGGADFVKWGDTSFSAVGTITFVEAAVGGLDFTGAEIACSNGPALVGNRMRSSGRVTLEELRATGRVVFIGASMDQLSVDRVQVELLGTPEKGNVFDDYTDLVTSTAIVSNADVVFLVELVDVRGNVIINKSEFSSNTIWQGTKIGGDLQIREVKFLGGKEAFVANQLKVGGGFRLRDITWGQGAKVSLRMATVMELDDLPNSYPTPMNAVSSTARGDEAIGTLDITGFEYSQFKDTSIKRTANRKDRDNNWTVDERLRWIARQTHQRDHDESTEGGYSPQPYLQLAEVYRKIGKDHERRKVLKRQQRDLRDWGELRRTSKWWSWCVDKMTGYGYESWRALVAILLIYLLSVSLTTVVRDHGGIVATGNTASYVVAKHGERAVAATSCTPFYPCNSSWLFPVDAAIPVINLHQSDFWSFTASNDWGNYGEIIFSLLSILGWGFTSLLIAASAGLIKQN